MTIDTKKLETDAAYWDEVAPDCATHYSPNRKEFVIAGEGWAYGIDSKYKSLERLVYPKQAERIPRPTKPSAPEWDGEGYPPVGCECEFKLNLTWVYAQVIGYDGPACVVAIDGEGYEGSTVEHDFRPIRTKEQREREEVDAVIRKAYLDGASGHIGGLAAITDAILSRYNLEPKP